MEIYRIVDFYFVNAGEGYVNITSPMDPIRVASLGWGLPDPKTGGGVMAGGHPGILGGGVDSRCNQTNLATTTNNAKKMIRPCRYSNACVETQESNLEATEKKNIFILYCVFFSIFHV